MIDLNSLKVGMILYPVSGEGQPIEIISLTKNNVLIEYINKKFNTAWLFSTPDKVSYYYLKQYYNKHPVDQFNDDLKELLK